MGPRMSNGADVSAPAIDPLPDAGQFSPRSISLGIAAGLAIFTVAALIATLRQQAWEFPLITAMNAVAGHSVLLDRFVHALTTRDLLQGVVFVALLWLLWFDTADDDDRARLLAGIAAASCAGFVSRLLQLALPTHLRPLHTGTLDFVMPAGVESEALNHFNAFPSDHGAVFFGLAIIVWRTRPWLGLTAFVWAAVVDFARVYEGYHYPSDILGSIGLSLLVVSVFQYPPVHRLARRLVAMEQLRRSWFYLVAFILTYQVATLFDDIRQIGRGFASAVLHHDPFAGS
jgi:membrane-associated phospholipid phosphatase